jgi:hypothetical protein
MSAFKTGSAQLSAIFFIHLELTRTKKMPSKSSMLRQRTQVRISAAQIIRKNPFSAVVSGIGLAYNVRMVLIGSVAGRDFRTKASA